MWFAFLFWWMYGNLHYSDMRLRVFKVGYMMGEISAAAGIAEEDDDEGLDAAAAHFETMMAKAPKRRRVNPDTSCGGAASGSAVPVIAERSALDEAAELPPDEAAPPTPAAASSSAAAADTDAASVRLASVRSQVGWSADEVPTGCSCRRYLTAAQVLDTGYWESKLPKGTLQHRTFVLLELWCLFNVLFGCMPLQCRQTIGGGLVLYVEFDFAPPFWVPDQFPSV